MAFLCVSKTQAGYFLSLPSREQCIQRDHHSTFGVLRYSLQHLSGSVATCDRLRCCINIGVALAYGVLSLREGSRLLSLVYIPSHVALFAYALRLAPIAPSFSSGCPNGFIPIWRSRLATRFQLLLLYRSCFRLSSTIFPLFSTL